MNFLALQEAFSDWKNECKIFADFSSFRSFFIVKAL